MIESNQIMNSKIQPKILNNSYDDYGKVRVSYFDFNKDRLVRDTTFNLVNLFTTKARLLQISLEFDGFQENQEAQLILVKNKQEDEIMVNNLVLKDKLILPVSGEVSYNLNQAYKSQYAVSLQLSLVEAVESLKMLKGYLLYVTD